MWTISPICSRVSGWKTIDVVDPIQELGIECPFDLLSDLVFHDLVAGLRIARYGSRALRPW
jgi:hypothetical protein